MFAMIDFWKIIDRARGGNEPKTPSVEPDALRGVLSDLSTEDVQEFLREIYRKQNELNQWDLWAAGYVINGGMGDDSSHYFRTWIIGKGRECFDVALKDPAGLLPFLDTLEVDNELLEYVGLEVLEGRGVERDPREYVDLSPDDEPMGEPFDEETVDDRFPELSKFAAHGE
jgi:hypothetical protein